ncbi:SDR family NAD(P)-dependent oxidoreductase, partial [Ameyamaea chiangmaiensis]
ALNAVCAEASARGGTMHAVTVDVGDSASIRRATAAIGDIAPRIDGLVNNAGVEDIRPSDRVDDALWDRLLDTNLRGAFFMAQQMATLMTGGGSIVNLASLTSAVGVPGAVPYSASKAGILGLTRGLAVEWAPRGIRVNAIGPGYFHTDMTSGFFADPAWQDTVLARIPLGRFGLPNDLAGPLQFLCSSASAYVTGQVFYVDGGILSAL